MSHSQSHILLLERIHPGAARKLRSFSPAVSTERGSLSPAELALRLKNISGLGIRSKTKISAETLAHAPRLETICCFCIGYDQVDVLECTRRGIAVFNAPYNNTRSVSELVIGLIIMLMRGTFSASAQMHAGVWRKSADDSFEVRGKKLGIVGYGHIGSQVSILAEALGMEAIYFDIRDVLGIGKVRRARTLRDLLREADIVTLHVPDTPQTRGLIGAGEIKAMRKGAWLINTSRGSVVKVEALREALVSGHLRGAALDVFPSEPSGDGPGWSSPLQGLANVILTPHVAGSTMEAQKEIGLSASEKMIRFLSQGVTAGSVNFPWLDLPELSRKHRLIHIHRNVPGVISHVGAALSKHRINIEGQHLETTRELGYLVTDFDQTASQELERDLREIPNTIRVRILY